jgi:hypothetical protein
VQIENAEWEDTTGDRLQAAMKTLDARARDILVSRWTGDAKRRCTTSPTSTACRPSASPDRSQRHQETARLMVA